MIQHAIGEPPGRSVRMGALPIVLRRHFSPFKLYVRRDARLAVFLNPKVGTQSFKEILLEGLEASGAAPGLSRIWPLPLRRRFLTARPRDYLDVLLHPQQYSFYCFVRNPYARLLSAWKDKFSLDAKGNPKARSMRRELPLVRRFAKRHKLPGATSGTDVPFPTFVGYVESQSDGRRNHHWDVQHCILCTDMIRYEQIYHMETDFAAGMTQILTRVGLSEAWITERLCKPRNVSRHLVEPVYNDELAERVHRIYQGDFERFDYDRESWRDL